MLNNYINNTLRDGTLIGLEYQILQGSGTGEELPGVLNTSNVNIQPFVTDVLTTLLHGDWSSVVASGTEWVGVQSARLANGGTIHYERRVCDGGRPARESLAASLVGLARCAERWFKAPRLS